MIHFRDKKFLKNAFNNFLLENYIILLNIKYQ